MTMILGGNERVQVAPRSMLSAGDVDRWPAARPQRQAVRVVCLPSWDEAFARIAEQHLASEPQTGGELEQLLRPLYPYVTVQPRRLSGEPQPTWYVYRDREAVRRDAVDWWTSEETPCLEAEWPDGRITRSNAAAQVFFGATAEEITGMLLVELLAAGAVPASAPIFELLRVRGRLETVMAIPRGDGSHMLCEVLATGDAEGIRACCRAIRVVDQPV